MKSSRMAEIQQGIAAAWPICLGYIPIGLALGVLGQKAGLNFFQIGGMSLLVFAGGSQFIAISMITQQAGMAAIILTTFLVNLRHLLMSSSLAVVLPPANIRVLSLYAYGVTDESFAVNLPLFQSGRWNMTAALTLNQAANLVWVLCTMAGAYGGRYIPENALGLNYALTAMFICLLVYQLRGRLYILTAVTSGMLAVLMYLLLPGNIYIVLAALLAATMSTLIKRMGKNR